MSAERHDERTLVRVVQHRTSSQWTATALDPPVGGAAVLELDAGNWVAVDPIDHSRLVSLVADMATGTGRALAEAWLAPDTIDWLRESGVCAEVETEPGPAAVHLGEAAVCELFSVVDAPAQEDLWVAESVASLTTAAAVDPRLTPDLGERLATAVRGVEAAAGRATGRDERALVAGYCRVLLQAGASQRDAHDLERLVADLEEADRFDLSSLTLGGGPDHAEPAFDPNLRAPTELDLVGTRSQRGERLDVVPVVARLALPEGFRLGVRSVISTWWEGQRLHVTFSEVESFPNQQGTKPQRVWLRAAVVGRDREAEFIDQVAVVHNADDRTASAAIDVAPSLVEDARYVVLDVPDNTPLPDVDDHVADGLASQLVLARLQDLLGAPADVVQTTIDQAADLAMVLGPGPGAALRSAVYRNQRRMIGTRRQLAFVELARRIRLDERYR